MENVLTKVYEEQEVAFRENNGQSEVRIDEVARFCGWTEIAKSGNECIKWARVNKHLVDLGASTVVATGDFIPEYIMYPLIGKAKNDRATQFMLWVGKVLVEIRQNGAYISPNITEEQEIKLDKFSTNKKMKNTFKTCNIESIENEYRECMMYHKNKDGKEKNGIQNIIINALSDRKQTLIDSGKGSFALVLAEVVNTISKKKTETSNKRNGQTIRYKNGIIDKQTQIINEKDEALNNLESKLNYYEPEDYEWIELNVHPFSHNYMTSAAKDWNTGNPKIVKSEGYYKWQNKFPYQELPTFDDLGIDFNKRVCAWFRFVAKSTFDPTNCSKTALDTICKYYDVDDNKIEMMECKKINSCKEFWEGKIYIAFRNQ